MADDFKSLFSEEILKNVFNEKKRNELCLNEEDILSLKKSERGYSIDEVNELNNATPGTNEN
jgi:hypothetical protein